VPAVELVAAVELVVALAVEVERSREGIARWGIVEIGCMVQVG